MNQSLKGKVAVITGGTQGLGAATARLFAARGAEGIVICGRNEAKGEAVAASITQCPVQFVRANVSNVDDCRRVISKADKAFGRVDCLINAAASTSRGTILDTTPELFDEIFDVNVRGPFFLMQSAIRVMMRENAGGSIVNIGSMSAHGGQSYLSPYATSKGALAVLTRNTAWSVLSHRIRVNGLNVGWMLTDHEIELQASLGNDRNWIEKQAENLPFGRLIQPEEVAKAIAFLCSEESGLMTGEIMNFDQSVPGSAETKPMPPIL